MSIHDIADYQFKKFYSETQKLKKEYKKRSMELFLIDLDLHSCLDDDIDVELALKLFRAKQNEDGTKFALKHDQLKYLASAPDYVLEKYKDHEVHVLKDIDRSFIKEKLYKEIDFLNKNETNFDSLFLIVVDYCILGNLYSDKSEVVGRIREKTEGERHLDRYMWLNRFDF